MPACGLIALAIWIEEGGHVCYCSERIGRGGTKFRMFKFRTMVDGERMPLDPEQIREWNANFKITADPRVTRIGKWLRRYSLDEILQVWNVFRGEMAFVGPRPKLPEEIGLYGEEKEELLSVLPGITGYWQLHRTSANSDATMREMDLFYVRNRTAAMDCRIIVGTVRAVLGHSNS
jgi:lipopolysaccharide/colanic/teichoic acid biosynthesis glycosyltransferase